MSLNDKKVHLGEKNLRLFYTQRDEENLGSNERPKKHFSHIYVIISFAVIASILLIATGIVNVQRTSQAAQANIERSLTIQRLNESLEIHEEAMNLAVEFAITSGESHWRSNYENSLLQLQENMNEVAGSLSLPILEKIRANHGDVIEIERKLFNLIARDMQPDAYALLATDEYQEKKILQDSQSLTLRTTLQKESQSIIDTLQANLQRTAIALLIQLGVLVTIWTYMVHMLRRWQITQQNHSSQLEQLAHYDSLTGIANRSLFQQRLDAAFKQAERTGKPVGLMLMDIDHFKDINDSLGHQMGDELLCFFANQLKRCCRETDTVARLGGDEFAIIVTDLKQQQYVANFCQRVLDLFSKPIMIHDTPIKSGTSIGVAFYPQDADHAEGLLRKADLALYEAKRAGRAKYQLFDLEIERTARHKHEIQEALEVALDNREFELAYQPIVKISSGEVIGVETLLRWRHPVRGLVSPVEFIGIAEESRLIVPIGAWVLEEACAQQLDWFNKLGTSISVAVNLSGVQFREKNLLKTIEGSLLETGMDPHRLTLEITESTLMETEGDIVQKLNELRDLGVMLAIDDFGTGYSSLAYLKRFPINYLKLDKAFVDDLPDDPRDVAIARSVINMAHELGLEIVAEGIETVEQLDFLNESACDRGQGYYLGKPMSAADLTQFMVETRNIYSNCAQAS